MSVMQPMEAPTPPTVVILLFDEVEVLDFAGPYEVFAGARDEAGARLVNVLTVGMAGSVQCNGGLRVLTDATLDNCPAFETLMVPGGPGARMRSESQQPLLEFIASAHRQGKLVASVCTGSFLLARAGLLEGRRATTHRQRLAQFREEFPTIEVAAEKIVDEGDLLTAGGVSSGIDLALYLLERWFGRAARQREAQRLEGPW